MLILDWLIIIIAIGIIVVQTARSIKDFEYVFFEMLGLLLAAYLAMKYYYPLSLRTTTNPALTLLIFYLVCLFVMIIVADLIANKLQFSLAPFDPYLGFILAVISAWSILSILLNVVKIAFPNGWILTLIGKEITIFDIWDNSALANEIVNFNSFKAVTNFLNRVKLSE